MILNNKFKVLFLLVFINFVFSKNNSDLEELVVKGKVLYQDQVSALKTPVPILNVPQTVSIITDEEILNNGFSNIEDIIRFVPGVTSSQGEGHRDAIVIRGIRSTADFYQDGIRDDVQYIRSLYNVDQLEILRGPNALLFGRGGTGGIVNRVTKKAVTSENFTHLNLGLNTFGGTDLAIDSNHILGINSGLRINLHTDQLENHRDHFFGNRMGINPSLTLIIGSELTMNLSYEYINHERFIDRGIPTLYGRPDTSLRNTVFGNPDFNYHTLEADIYRLQASYQMSDAFKANFNLTANNFEKVYQNIYTSDYDGSLILMDGYLDPTKRDNFIFSSNLINEINYGKVIHTLLFGIEYIQTTNNNSRFDAYWSATQNDTDLFSISTPIDFAINSSGIDTSLSYLTPNSKTHSEITISSFYLQDQIDLSERWKLVIGARLDQFDISVEDHISNTLETKKDNTLSPRGGLIFKPQQNVSMYLSYSESFLPRSGEQYKKLNSSAARLDPDVFESKEIGIKILLNNQLNLSAAYFNSQQIRAARDNISGETYNIRGLSVDGYELEVKGDIGQNFSYVIASYTSLNGKTQSGGTPREIPEFTFSANAQYQLTNKLNLGFGYLSQGESLIMDDNEALTLPQYSRLDISGSYSYSERLTLRLHLENLFDELYFPHAHAMHQVSVGEPFNARVVFSYYF